jgi:hypothetical protein
MADGTGLIPGAAAERQPLPADGYLTALQLMNWLAFGSATNSDMTGGQDFKRTWLFAADGSEWPSAGKHPFLAAIEALKDGATQWPPHPEETFSVRRRRVAIFERARERLADWNISPTSLAGVFQIQMDGHLQRRRAIASARREVLRAMEVGTLPVLAVPVVDGVASPAGAVQVPIHFFATPGIWLDDAGQIGSQFGWAYAGARFAAGAVAAAWPSGLSSAAPMRTGFAGRPTSRPLVEEEMRRRFRTGEAHRTQASEMAHLSVWLKQTHPLAPNSSPQTLKNSLGRLFNELNSRRPKLSS